MNDALADAVDEYLEELQKRNEDFPIAFLIVDDRDGILQVIGHVAHTIEYVHLSSHTEPEEAHAAITTYAASYGKDQSAAAA